MPASRLYARFDHEHGCRHLLCAFNSYDCPAAGRETRLQNSKWLLTYGLSTLWFAEADADAGSRTWYTGFDFEIQQWLRQAIRGQGIRHVTFVGSSVGGYAGLRHAMLLGDEPELVSATAYAVNAQTGFGEPLLDEIRAGMRRVGWRQADLGDHPILPRRQDLCAAPDAVPESDLLALGRALPISPKVRLELFYDAHNPIEAGFSERLGALRGARLHPFKLGVPHGAGARHILLSRRTREHMDEHLGLWPEGRGQRPLMAQPAMPDPPPFRAAAPVEPPAAAPAIAAPSPAPAPMPPARDLARLWRALAEPA